MFKRLELLKTGVEDVEGKTFTVEAVQDILAVWRTRPRDDADPVKVYSSFDVINRLELGVVRLIELQSGDLFALFELFDKSENSLVAEAVASTDQGIQRGILELQINGSILEKTLSGGKTTITKFQMTETALVANKVK